MVELAKTTHRLEKLTPAQEALLPKVRDEWLAIGLSTQPADRPVAEEGMRQAYRAVGLEPPNIVIWLGSPMAGAIGAVVIAGLANRQLSNRQVRDQVWNQVGAQVGAQVGDQVRAQVGDQVRAQVWAQVWKAGYGQHDADWLSFYDAVRRCEIEISPLNGLITLGRSCGWFWSFSGLCILTERPCELHRDDRGRLHSVNGMAIKYPDGWGIYAIHGVRLQDPRAITAPEALTVQDVHNERNAEVRRVLIERMGYDRYLRESGAKKISSDEWGTLWRTPVPDDEDLVLVELLNSTPEPDGTTKTYWLRTHPQLRPLLGRDPNGRERFGEPQKLTALNAIGASFGMTGREYAEALQAQS